MKTSFFFAICLWVSFTSIHAQSSDHTSPLFKSAYRHISAKPGDLALNLNFHKQPHYENNLRLGGGEGAGYRPNRLHEEIKQGRNGGIALTIVGAVLMTGGVALIAVGAPQIKNNFNNGGDFLGPFYETYFGVGTLLAGTGMSIGGVIMWVKKQNRLKKYEMNHPDQFQ